MRAAPGLLPATWRLHTGWRIACPCPLLQSLVKPALSEYSGRAIVHIVVAKVQAGHPVELVERVVQPRVPVCVIKKANSCLFSLSKYCASAILLTVTLMQLPTAPTESTSPPPLSSGLLQSHGQLDESAPLPRLLQQRLGLRRRRYVKANTSGRLSQSRWG